MKFRAEVPIDGVFGDVTEILHFVQDDRTLTVDAHRSFASAQDDKTGAEAVPKKDVQTGTALQALHIQGV